jgi:hypothetical protein
VIRTHLRSRVRASARCDISAMDVLRSFFGRSWCSRRRVERLRREVLGQRSGMARHA